MSYYFYFIHTIYLLKWFENNYTPCYGLSLMEKYIANFFTMQMELMKEFFQNGRSGLANKYTMFWINERGGNKFQVFGRGTQKVGDMS